MQDIIKTESTKQTVPKTTIRREQGQPRLVTSNRFIDDQRKHDLKMPRRFITYDNMYMDDCVYNSIDITNLLSITALFGGSFVSKSGKQKSNKAADFLNYCIRNMTSGTYLEFLQNMVTDIRHGFSIQNIVTEKRKYGPWKGSWVLKKLSPRDQKSLYGWLWNKDQTELLGMVQKPRLTATRDFNHNISYNDGLRVLAQGKFYESNYPIVRTTQMLHSRFNCTNNNPQGDSPLNYCYTAWMEKKLIEEYQTIGVSKDLGGMIVLRVPSKLIEHANDKDRYPEAFAEYQALQENAADLHAGKSSFMLLTSDSYESTKKYMYDIQLQGIEGSGKQYNTEDIINQKKNSIYNCFGTGFLLLGQDSVGSYNLSSSATSTHGYYIERNILQKEDTLNNQLAPRLLVANDIYLNWEDMPVYKSINPTETSSDELSKTVQRMASVNKITPKALMAIYEEMGWDTEGIEDLDFNDKGQSRAGDGMATAGEGTSNSFGGKGSGDASIANNENAGITKDLVFGSETEETITLIDTKTGSPVFIDK